MNLKHLPKEQYITSRHPHLFASSNETLPAQFSWRNQASECMVPVIDQGECGSCYAHATSSMLAERLCIHADRSKRSVVPLSPNWIMSCDPMAYGCNGGVIGQVLEYLEDPKEVGIPTLACAGGYHNETLDCPQACHDGSHPKHFVKCAKDSRRQYLTVEEIKRELMENGPVASQMVVYEDLLTYRSGVFYHREGTIIGGHAVLLVGWGSSNSTLDPEEYWEVQNSWGSDWGENGGFFRIRLGDSEIATELFGGSFSCTPVAHDSIFAAYQFLA